MEVDFIKIAILWKFNPQFCVIYGNRFYKICCFMEIRLFLQHYNSFETLICRARCTSRAEKMPEK